MKKRLTKKKARKERSGFLAIQQQMGLQVFKQLPSYANNFKQHERRNRLIQ